MEIHPKAAISTGRWLFFIIQFVMSRCSSFVNSWSLRLQLRGNILRSSLMSLLSQWRHKCTSLDSSLNLTCLLIYIMVVYHQVKLCLFISRWFPVLIHKMTSLWRKKTCVFLVHCYRESQFLGRLLRSPGSPRRRKGSGALKVETGVWNSQGRGKGKLFFLSTFLAAKSLQLCPTLCDPIDSSPLGSSVPGILQARMLDWFTISFSYIS